MVEWNTWALLYAGLVVLAGGALTFMLVRTRGRKDGPAATAPAPADGASSEGRTLADLLAGAGGPEPYMAQFVHSAKGDRVGETIGVDGTRVILKAEGKFTAVPAASIRVRSGLLVADADVDWKAAERAGEAWRSAGSKPIEYDDTGMPKA